MHCRGLLLGATPFSVFFGRPHTWDSIAEPVYLKLESDDEAGPPIEVLSDEGDALAEQFQDTLTILSDLLEPED